MTSLPLWMLDPAMFECPFPANPCVAIRASSR
jgi:hypothetical protein